MLKLNESLAGYSCVCNPFAMWDSDCYFKDFLIERRPRGLNFCGSGIPVPSARSRAGRANREGTG